MTFDPGRTLSETRAGAHPLCRHCGAPLTRSFADLGAQPLANSYLPPGADLAAEPRYPLHARVCDRCFLVQVDDVVPPDAIFHKDYAYFSSFSASWLDHCRAYAGMAAARFGLGPESLVIEIASNDGYLLQYFVETGIPVLGIEPAANCAAAAIARGVPTRIDFFGEALARRLRAEGHRPDLVASANVLAHVPDINDFVRGVAVLLEGEAVWTVEFPHLLNLIREVQFDTIYHEHFSYLSLLAVERILAAAGLRVFDVEALPTHGGSLRVYACLEGAARPQGPAVAAMRAEERAAGLDRAEGYAGFQARCEELRAGLLDWLAACKSAGRRVAAYGAAAKGNTLLNFAGVTAADIAYVVDRNPAKQNTLLPGSHIPVHPVAMLETNPPDELLILPWNLRAEIMDQLRHLAQGRMRFVTAVPRLTVLG